ncbi:MAG: hypothetical protein ACM3MF_08535 [Anaerolineae bacterium]
MPSIIRASEIGAYLYCRRAWWYRKQGIASQNQAEMANGTELHRQHGRTVIAAGFLQTAGYALLLIAVLIVVGYLTLLVLK